MALHRIRLLHAALADLGVTGSSVEAAHPKTTIGTDEDKHISEDLTLFAALIVEDEIVKVSSHLYASGHYNIAVSEAFKALDNFISEKVSQPKSSGTPMMEAVFSPTNPKLVWSGRKTSSEEDEQKGYQRIFAGAMLGIRNPTTHEFEWVDDPDQALELLCFAQHLLRKAKAAELPS